jgi:ribonuclease HI
MGNNVNAVTNSAHLKGKTIDISYVRFGNNTAQLDALVKALKKMRKEDKCYVKYERTQGCLHITVR